MSGGIVAKYADTCTVVGNAKLDGLTKDLNITGNQYLLTLTIYFIGYVCALSLAVASAEGKLIHSKGSV